MVTAGKRQDKNLLDRIKKPNGPHPARGPQFGHAWTDSVSFLCIFFPLRPRSTDDVRRRREFVQKKIRKICDSFHGTDGGPLSVSDEVEERGRRRSLKGQ